MRTTVRSYARSALMALLALPAFVLPLGAQRFRQGTLPLLTTDQATSLRQQLLCASANADWDGVLRTYFGALYDSSFVDLVVYVPGAGGAVKQALIHDGRVRTTVNGAKFVYVLVFADNPPRAVTKTSTITVATGSKDTTDTVSVSIPTDDDLVLSLTALDYQKDRFLSSLVKSIAGKLGAGLDPARPAAPDSSASVKLSPVTGDPDTSPLYVAEARFALAERTANRISIRPAIGRPYFPKDRSIHYNFGNASGSRFGLSLGGGMTFAAKRETVEDIGDTTQAVKQGGYVRMAFYLLGHVHLNPPHLPWDRFSFSLTAGTNLFSGDLLDDLVAGLTIGRVGDIGLMVGGNLFQSESLERSPGLRTIKRTRKLRAFVGLDFAL